MQGQESNIILIGMPGSGKSTVGVILAKLMSRAFVDTDLLIQAAQGRSLQDIIDKEGHLALRQIEQQILLNLTCTHHVIATGGSAVYSNAAMCHLKSSGVVVFLDVGLATLERRVHNFETRGLAKRSDQSFADLFRERLPLYKKYADITLECSTLTQDEISEEINKKLSTRLANNEEGSR